MRASNQVARASGPERRGPGPSIEVRAHQSLNELDPVAMEKVNASSTRASLFAGPAWLSHFVTHDLGFHERGSKPFILAAWEGGTLKGYLPLKANHDRGGRVLSSIITGEVERPQVVCAPEDEERVTQAFIRFLLDGPAEWDLLEFVQQDQTSLLASPPGLTGRHWLRRLGDRPSNVLALPFADMTEYAGSLSKSMRYTKKRELKGILAAPGLTVTIGKNPRACAALFEVLLDIERRSWKHRVDAGVGTRVKTYRAALADPRVETAACIASVDGVPMGGSLWVHYGKRSYHLQTVYAESYEALAPGTLLTCVTIADVLERKSVAFDMLPDFSHYKVRWGAQAIETQWVQIFRVGSRRHLTAVAGDFWRKVNPRPQEAGAQGKNPYRLAAGKAVAERSFDKGRLDALLCAAREAGATVQDAATLSARKLLS